MDLTSLMKGQLNDQLISQLSQQLGGVDKKQTATATASILTTLMGAMAKNARSPEGASALNHALEQDHDGGILDNLTSVLTGKAEMVNPRSVNGSGILKHVLGERQSGAVDMISRMSGLDQGKTGSLMTMLAPMVMGMLGKAKQEQNLDAGGVAGMLDGFLNNTRQQKGSMGMITGFLDADGDGSIIDDLAAKFLDKNGDGSIMDDLAGKFLGGLFGRKRK
jgi:hypothetical protein